MLTLLITFALNVLTACNHFPNQQSSSAASSQRTTSVKSQIRTGEDSHWKWRETKIRDGVNLDRVQFLNADQGFASGEPASLYKTFDGGETWDTIKIEMPPDSDIASFHFISPLVGWVISNKNSHDTLVLHGYESDVHPRWRNELASPVLR